MKTHLKVMCLKLDKILEALNKMLYLCFENKRFQIQSQLKCLGENQGLKIKILKQPKTHKNPRANDVIFLQ